MSIYPIVIIGAGPAGIATAIEAINRGYKTQEIIILERSGEICHMINQKYPDEKPILANYKGRLAACIGDMCITDMSKEDFFEYLHDVVAKYQLQIKFNHQVTSVVNLKNGQFNVQTLEGSYTCNVVFVAIGNMAAPRHLDIPIPSGALSKLHYDIQKLSPREKKVLVVGGGDSAAEYTKILSDRGYEVTLSYRGKDFTRMIEQNKMIMKELISSGKITYIPESRLAAIEDHQNFISIKFKEDSLPELKVDAVVVALGAERPNNYLNSIGIKTETESRENFSESKMKGLFFVGDLAMDKMGGSINFAFNSGVSAVTHACDMYLDCTLPSLEK